jgi:hypothetical protein
MLAGMVIVMLLVPLGALLSVVYQSWKELKEEQKRWKK